MEGYIAERDDGRNTFGVYVRRFYPKESGFKNYTE